MQLPMFPAGVTEINSRVAVDAKDGRVCYVHGHLPVFQHEEEDVWSFRMFTSQMIVNGTAKPKEIVEAFGVPMVTVKRYNEGLPGAWSQALVNKVVFEEGIIGPAQSEPGTRH